MTTDANTATPTVFEERTATRFFSELDTNLAFSNEAICSAHLSSFLYAWLIGRVPSDCPVSMDDIVDSAKSNMIAALEKFLKDLKDGEIRYHEPICAA